MTTEYRCPECGRVFKPGWIMDWDSVEIGDEGCFYYQYCTVDCDCGRTLRFTTFYEVTDVMVEEIE